MTPNTPSGEPLTAADGGDAPSIWSPVGPPPCAIPGRPSLTLPPTAGLRGQLGALVGRCQAGAAALASRRMPSACSAAVTRLSHRDRLARRAALPPARCARARRARAPGNRPGRARPSNAADARCPRRHGDVRRARRRRHGEQAGHGYRRHGGYQQPRRITAVAAPAGTGAASAGSRTGRHPR